MIPVAGLVFLGLLGAAAAWLGQYGWRHGAALVPEFESRRYRSHRVGVVRRGAAASFLVGVAVVVVVVVAAAVGR